MRFTLRPSCTLFVGIVVASIVVACGEGARGASPRAAGAPVVAVDTSSGTDSVQFVLLGLSSDELRSLRGRSERGYLRALFAVSIDADDAQAVLGKYAVNDSAVVFRPSYPLDRGRAYRASVNFRALAVPRPDSLRVTLRPLPARADGAPARVTGVSIGDSVPENLLRVYLEFSAPMSRVGALPYVALVDAEGRVVPNAFLPLEADFWNAARTRYTLFLDPGRVKQGILPNEQMGRPIRAGSRYAIRVDSTFPDENGQPLTASFTRAFAVTPAVARAIDIAAWQLTSPAPGSRAALEVRFPTPLDRGLLQRALGVEHANGKRVEGEVQVDSGDRRWRFIPSATWSPGAYRVVVLSILEDAAGNRIDGAFEVDNFDRVDSGAPSRAYYRPFTVR